jgi:cyclopropane fatty-acyl-phospholipid synthase-like methyltransferase
MTVRIDPEGNETAALFDLVDLEGREVLEIGCGDGRLTWRYADRAAHVTAIEPFEDAIARANSRLSETEREDRIPARGLRGLRGRRRRAGLRRRAPVLVALLNGA